MNLEKVFQAIENINGVRLIIAGYGDQVNDIKRWADNTADKVKYIGRIGYEEVLERTMASNLLFALYDPSVAAVRHASCNKLFEAMMSQKPILVSKGTAMEDIVEREKCGITVDSGSTEQIGKAIVRLKENPELCRQLGQNGRKAYEQKYNREIMEQRLLELYHKMLNKNSQGRI